METKRYCPSCHKPLPPDVPLGLCPECLIRSGFQTGTEPGAASRESAGFVPPPVEQIAKLFPQLEILELIGKGGMGAVYKARQPALDRFVALKILPPNAARDPGFAERFNREARALARLTHPNIVAVHDFGQAGGLHYLIMEFVDGANLRDVERAGRLAPEQALAIVPQICDALQFAHNEGVVHRDIKPENLLLDKRGRVKITDFGIAKILGQTSAGKLSLTGAKDVVGTPHYMAPEQIEKPQLVDHRADIYSLGVVFYEMLTGELPLGKFQPPSNKVQIDVRLDEVVLRTLAKEPERRYQQASQVKTDVETIVAGAAKSEVAQPDGITRSWMGFPFVEERDGEPVVLWVSVAIAWIVCWGILMLVIPMSWMVAGDKFGRFISLPACLGIGTLLSTVFAAVGVWWTRWLAGAGVRAPDAFVKGMPLFVERAGRRQLYWPGVLFFCSTIGLTVGCIVIGSALALWLPGQTANHPARAASANQPPLRVTGIVTDAVTGQPIAGARVDDNRYGAGETPQQAWTDTNGGYELKTWYEEHNISASAPGYEPKVATLFTKSFGSEKEMRMDFQLPPENASGGPAFGPLVQGATRLAKSDPQRASVSEPDHARALALFNDIEDFGHEFSAAFSSTNLAAARTGTRRLLNLLTNFNAAVQGTDYEFPSAILDDVAKVDQALAEGDWDKARRLGAGNDAYRERFRQIAGKMAALARQQRPSAAVENFARLLNDNQRLVIDSTDRQFRSFFDSRTFDGWSEKERADLETRLMDVLKGPQTREYYQAVNTLGALHSTNALLALRGIVFDRADKNNRDRWMAIRVLGILGDKPAIPELIHLVYHGNPNTRWWAQISLVRLTGKNFAKDWEAWGKWWNESGGQPPFQPEIIRWWSGQAEPEKLAASLEEGDRKYFADIRPRDGARQSAEDASPAWAELPPVVVATQPVSGARGVEASVAEIRATFSKEMMDGSWSWCTAWENSMPEMIGDPKYEPDGRTCVIRVKLEPARTYAIWLNAERFQNFKDRTGRPAVPYLLIFETKKP